MRNNDNQKEIYRFSFRKLEFYVFPGIDYLLSSAICVPAKRWSLRLRAITEFNTWCDVTVANGPRWDASRFWRALFLILMFEKRKIVFKLRLPDNFYQDKSVHKRLLLSGTFYTHLFWG